MRLERQEHDRFPQMPDCLRSNLLVEIDSQEKTGLVLKHWVNACDERLAGAVNSRKVPMDHLVCHGEKLSILTLRALNTWFLTDTANPFIAAGRRVTRFSGFAALESPGINIISPAEERAKEPDFGVSCGVLMNQTRFEEHGLFAKILHSLRPTRRPLPGRCPLGPLSLSQTRSISENRESCAGLY